MKREKKGRTITRILINSGKEGQQRTNKKINVMNLLFYLALVVDHN